ncbi:caspase-1-A-like isoform X2 [Acanthopagrus latus]|uniref:caspase-1-A-like isoform X2 n=1 Tax=Acanthopagrus latus TaxID=8177 RepID=UPI00187CD63E|nr:caspase-1-A-like isoform X2 [Acanthopagrus latus]
MAGAVRVMADKQLAVVRSTFVEKVSIAVIGQLLDDLSEDGVLNDLERESILEQNSTRVDKARALIDTVKRKGDAPSARMIARLQSRDPALYTLLDQTLA